MTTNITVNLDGRRSYEIVIGNGILVQAADFLLPLLPTRRVCIITDENVDDAGHAEILRHALEVEGINVHKLVLKAGEQTKCFSNLEFILNYLLEIKAERSVTLIAVGGGVIGDITGFAASVLLRGVPFVQVPTSLLAMVDSSVGGKTGINTPYGKNLVGTFYQPKLVLADMDTLATLPKREVLAGYAEVVKYGLIDHPDFFNQLENNTLMVSKATIDVAMSDVATFLAYCVHTSCQAKAAIVAQDEHEGGVRALLNLGHSFGHALEAEMNYDGRLLHGEAVAIGMCMAFRFSVEAGICDESEVGRITRHFQSVGLPTAPKDVAMFRAENLLEAMRRDKKVQHGAITLILARGIGQAFIQKNVAETEILAFLEKECAV